MSFSSELKSELGGVFDKARHCRIAELAAIISMVGTVKKAEDGNYSIEISVESPVTAKKTEELLFKIFNISVSSREKRSARNFTTYCFSISGDDAVEISEAMKIRVQNDRILPDVNRLTVKNCCKRAFLRGAFITAGSVSDPDRHYHLEFPCKEKYTADRIEQLINSLHLEPRMVERQRYHVVYLKDSSRISELLALMGARTGLLDLENYRIKREVRGNINRRVNCETANINKTAMASAKQIEAIELIKRHMDLNLLPKGLDEMARVRLLYPEASLGELGQYLEPPVGKSGVNHRLRRLVEISESLKSLEEGFCD